MKDQQTSSTSWTRIVMLVVGLAIMAVLLLPAVKGALNRIPHIWEVLYPILTLFAAFLTVSALAVKEHALIVLKWALLLAAAAGVTVYTFGGAHLFFTIGRWSAIAFIAAEVIDALVETVTGTPEMSEA